MLVERARQRMRVGPIDVITVRRTLAAILLLAAISAGAQAQDAASADRFLRQVYAAELLEPGPKAEDIYDPELLDLIQRDRVMIEEHEMALMRFDPICACQDNDGLRVSSVTVRPKSATQMDGIVVFTLLRRRTALDYQLVSVNGQWRIHDILNGTVPSLRQYLITGLAAEERDLKKAGR